MGREREPDLFERGFLAELLSFLLLQYFLGIFDLNHILELCYVVPNAMKKTSGKHKRGEEGSLEEEDNVPKRCNMADSIGEVQILEATQPKQNVCK